MDFFQNRSAPSPPQAFWNFWGTFPKVQLFRNFWGTFLCPISPNIWGKVPQNIWIWSTPFFFENVPYLGPQVVCQGGEDAYYGQEGDQGGVQVPGGGQEGTWGAD